MTPPARDPLEASLIEFVAEFAHLGCTASRPKPKGPLHVELTQRLPRQFVARMLTRLMLIAEFERALNLPAPTLQGEDR